MSTVGKKIMYWRTEKRFMSIRGLARASGIKPNTISEIEKGIRTPQHNTLVQIAKGLGITLDDLADTEIPNSFQSQLVA